MAKMASENPWNFPWHQNVAINVSSTKYPLEN